MNDLRYSDLELTIKICNWEQYAPVQCLQKYGKIIITYGNFISLVGMILTLDWFCPTHSKEDFHLSNLLGGLFVDCINSGLLKAIFRRSRPAGSGVEDMVLVYGPQKFSMPSAHASRATFVCGYLLCIWGEVSMWKITLIFSWAMWVILAQILMRLNYFYDQIAGVMLGALEVAAIFCYFNPV